MLDTAILSNMRLAVEFLDQEPPNGVEAIEALRRASETVGALMGAYKQSDPLLRERLASRSNAIAALAKAIEPIAGYGPDLDWIRTNLARSMKVLEGIRGDLH